MQESMCTQKINGEEEAKKWHEITKKEDRMTADLSLFNDAALDWLGNNGGFKPERAYYNAEKNRRLAALKWKRKGLPPPSSSSLFNEAEEAVDTASISARLAEIQKQMVETKCQLEKERKKYKRQKMKVEEEIGVQDKELQAVKDQLKQMQTTILHAGSGTPVSLLVNKESEEAMDSSTHSGKRMKEDDSRSIDGSNISITSGPSVAFVGSTIRAPVWKSSENIESARAFIREYRRYREEVLIARKNGYNMPLVTVYNCLEDNVKEKLRFELTEGLETCLCDDLLNHIEATRITASLINIDLRHEQPVNIWLDGTLPVPTVSRWLVAVKQYLDKRNAAHLLDSKNSEDQKRVAEYLMRGIAPNTLLIGVRNELNGDMDKLNVDRVRRAVVNALEKGGIYVNNKMNKEKKDNVRRNDRDYHKPNQRDSGRTFSLNGRTDRVHKRGKMNNQIKKTIMDIDVNHPPPGIHLSIDPTNINDKGICAVCLNKGHFVKDCSKATTEQKQWYHAYTRKKYLEKDKGNTNA